MMTNLNEMSTRRRKAEMVINGMRKNVRTFCIMSCENPDGKPAPKDVNDKNYSDMKDMLTNHHFLHFPVKGKYGDIERSFIIYNISLDACKMLARKYSQQSFIFAVVNDEGVEFRYYLKSKTLNDYRFVEAVKNVNYVTSDNDNFTIIGKNFKFTLPFKIFEEHIAFIDNILNEKCKEPEKLQYYINESVSEESSLRSQRIYRKKILGI